VEEERGGRKGMKVGGRKWKGTRRSVPTADEKVIVEKTP